LSVEPPPDRFLEHAIIYALFSVATPNDLTHALQTGKPLARKAALLALEQIHPEPLQRADVAPLLSIDHAGLRESVLWVLARHPDWAGDVTTELATWMKALDLKDEVSQAVMKPVGAEGYDYTYVIMPMRV
jgi:hypothetical protein